MEWIVEAETLGDLVDGLWTGGKRLVRCKDCKWCDDAGKGRALICTNEYIDTDCHPDFYCGYGKRKD